MSSLLRLESKQKIFQMHFEFGYFYLSLLMWRGIEAIINAPVVPSKTIADSRQNGQSIYPFSDQKA